MALTPEELQILQRIETLLKGMPFYFIEDVRSKKRAGLSADTLLQYLYRYQHFFQWLLREDLRRLRIPLLSLIPYWRN